MQTPSGVKGFLCFCIFIWFSSSSCHAQIRGEIYSEGFFRSESDEINHMFFARLSRPLGSLFAPFLEGGSGESGGEERANDLYFGPGISIDLSFVKIFAQHRFHSPLVSLEKSGEWRFLLVSGFRRAINISIETRWEFFWEPYTEFLRTSRTRTSHFWNSFLRGGFQYPISNASRIEIFLEPRLSISEQENSFFVSQQISPTLGLRTCQDQFCLALSAARVLPVKSNLPSEFSFLASVGGNL